MPRLLLIEDEIGAIAALKRVLARAGHEVLVSTNLPDALSAIEQEAPDALLVAAGLQGESAGSLVEAIRGVDLTKPMIVLGDGLGCGEAFLPKPVDAAKLNDLLRELLPGSAAPPMPNEAPAAPAALFATPSPAVAPAATASAPAPSTPAPPVPARALTPGEVERRREMVARTLAEAAARRRAAEAARRPEQKPPTIPVAASQAPPASATPPPSPAQPPAPAPVRAFPIPPPAPVQAVQPAAHQALAAQLFEDSTPEKPEPHAQWEPDDLPLFAQPAAPPSQSIEASPAATPKPAPEIPLKPARTPPQPPSRVFADRPTKAADPLPAFEPGRPSLQRRRAAMNALEIPHAGTLEAVEPVALLLACHRARISGQLKLDQGLVQRALYFEDGRLVGAASSSTEERLEALSYRRGLISRDQQRLLRSETQVPTRRLALLMVERAYLKPAELFPLVQERVEEVIYEACGGFSGKYKVVEEPVPDDERVALARSPLALATEAIRRKYLMDRLLAGLGGPATLLRPARGPELSEYGLTARERRLAQSVDGLRNIEELLFESGNEPLPGLKVLYALVLGRSVEIAMRGLQDDSASEVEAGIDLTRVAEKYEQVRVGNYFEVLGIGPSATAYEIEQAYERLAREFQPERFRDLRQPELPDQLDEIQRLLAEARDILVDEGLREEYRAHLLR